MKTSRSFIGLLFSICFITLGLSSVQASVSDWKSQKFTAGELSNAAISGDLADPNHNGISNLLEYTLNGDPKGSTTGTGILPVISVNGNNRLQAVFNRYLDRDDLTITVQGTDSLTGNWTDLASSVNGADLTVIAPGVTIQQTGSGNARTVTVTDLYQVTDPLHGKRFMRLKVVPAPAAGQPIGGFTLQNAGTQNLGAGVATLGQSFAQGELPAGAGLVASINGAPVTLQSDVKTTYPDGSVKMAILAIDRPLLTPGQSLDVVLKKASSPSGATPINLAQAIQSHTFTVDLTLQGQSTQRFDVLAALQSALANQTATYWQKGELATQARVEILPGGSQRLLFDVTAFKGGGLKVDAQFNNDIAMGLVGGRVTYDVLARLDGQTVLQNNFSQGQYQNLHLAFTTSAVDGSQCLGSPTTGWLNIKFDAAKLGAMGAIARYDLSLKISDRLIQGFVDSMQTPQWGKPFNRNDVTQYMPQTGGRADIGISTRCTTAWVISQDPRVAAYSLGQAETASVIPWSFWDQANRRWLSTENYPEIGIDSKGEDLGIPGDPTSAHMTQRVNWEGTDWVPETSHQPNLSFIPYLLTGQRWMLDNLNAQAAYNILDVWVLGRKFAQNLVVYHNQIRGSAWGLRQLQDAAYANPDGTVEQRYFKASAESNWRWLVGEIPTLTDQQKEAHGWLDPGDYFLFANGIGNWQQDFFASTILSAVSRGYTDATTYFNWSLNYYLGRCKQSNNGFQLLDSMCYALTVYDPITSSLFKTWREIGNAMVARGQAVNPPTYWGQGYFDAGTATLAGIYKLTGNPDALTAYKAIMAANPPFVSKADFESNPNFAIAIPGIYSDCIGDYNPDGTYTSYRDVYPPPLPATANVALNRPATSQTIYSGEYSAGNAFDGDPNSRWASAPTDKDWIVVDLGQRTSFSRMVLKWDVHYASFYTIQVSDDGVNWSIIYTKNNGNGDTDDFDIVGTGRYVKLEADNGQQSPGFSIRDFKIY